jgi:hypothetical protein
MLGRVVIRNGYHAWMMGIAMVALDPAQLAADDFLSFPPRSELGLAAQPLRVLRSLGSSKRCTRSQSVGRRYLGSGFAAGRVKG